MHKLITYFFVLNSLKFH